MVIRAGFISSAPSWHWVRQFPNSIPSWNGVNFSFDENWDDKDIVFVYDAIPSVFGNVTAKRCMFIASEPPSVKNYDQDYLQQFDCVLTPDASTFHPNKRTGPLGLPWLIGAYDENGAQSSIPMTYDDFKAFYPAKTKLMSVVSSNKAFTPGHRSRLEFVEKVKSHFGDNIDVFGRNINGFSDKTGVLAAYRYHIAIENSAYENYWTEKISDPLLSLTYPIYYGDPNINRYFSDDTITRIDINDVSGSISKIERIIDADTASKSLPYLESARNAVLQDYNLFYILSNYAHELVSIADRKRTLKPELNYLRKKKRKAKFTSLVSKFWR